MPSSYEHYHCPHGCEKPQETLIQGRLLCMRCWCLSGAITEMVLCDATTCPNDIQSGVLTDILQPIFDLLES